jgi:ABC-type transport system involved in multi-copper enzyme maturation permease subunit
MIGRNGLGPVFVYDMRTMVRRWQLYAVRAAFVLFLLVGMMFAWWSSYGGWDGWLEFGSASSIQELAAIGETFYYGLAGVQLSFLLLAAPAATAGSICIDRARGTLLHMMVTDLSDSEIVLGRLGSRLMPVFGLVASAVPVIAMVGLLGGIDFEALLILFVVSIGVAIFGCSLALAISVKASKTHEVLMAVYLAFGAWLLILPIWLIFVQNTAPSSIPDWIWKSNPYFLIYAPYWFPDYVGMLDLAIFFGVLMVLSLAMVGGSILSLRRAVVSTKNEARRAKPRFAWLSKFELKFPGPTLEGNPVLWREWHRNQPSRLARWLWRGMMFVTWGMVLGGLVLGGDDLDELGQLADLGLILQGFFGFLMVAATSPTVLAEERTRGSLDVLMSTPLSTRSIVNAKWWGAFRIVLMLAILPTFVAVFLAFTSPDLPSYASAMKSDRPAVPLNLFDRIIAPIFCLVDLLVSGALIVSVGVLIATWIPRVGRAVGTSVVIFMLIGVGWAVFVETLSDLPEEYQNALESLSPVLSPLVDIGMFSSLAYASRITTWIYQALAILAKLAAGGFFLWLSILTFNRCLSRVDERRPANFQPPVERIGPRSKRWWRAGSKAEAGLTVASE